MTVYVLQAWYQREAIAVTTSYLKAQEWLKEDDEHYYTQRVLEE